MTAQDDGDGIDAVAEFAALLRALKERTDRSYGSLARRLGMNTSTLHRYCAGDAVPLDFAPVERFAALCGASPEQRLELHRRWLLAVASRHRPRTADATRSAPDATAAQTVNDAAEGPDPAGEGTTGPRTAPKAAGDPAAVPDAAPKAAGDPAAVPDAAPRAAGGPAAQAHPARRPWYRRGRVVASLACGCAVLAALGALAAPPEGRRTSADGPARVAGPTASGPAEARAPGRRETSPGPSTAPTSPTATERAPGTATPKRKPGAAHPSDATSAPPPGERPAAPPLTWSANSQAWELGCGHDYVVAKPPGQVPPPPAPQDAAPWAATQNAVHGRETLVQLSVQGRSGTAVVLEELRVRVVGRTAPAGGNAYAMDQGCGGSITPRYFAVDLDQDRPIARAVARNDSGTPIPAVRMPYRVSAKDPEVLLITAETSSCDCRWYLELDWSSQGRTGTARIDDNGRPFRTSAIEGLPRYTYDTLERQWRPYS
ncbi:transcriptional regulator [Streptomyces tendae]|uniref:transcriptional regulator n=1 Tax=Streptomyces tendae TaxID=1932 RepID=UPI00379DD2E4